MKSLSLILGSLLGIGLTMMGLALPGLLLFFVVFVLAACQGDWKPFITYPNSNQEAWGGQTELESEPKAQAPQVVYQIKKITEAEERRVEQPDGSAIQVRRVRQWH